MTSATSVIGVDAFQRASVQISVNFEIVSVLQSPMQLAVGMDKARNDSSLIVWDTTSLSSSGDTPPADRTRCCPTPLCCHGYTDRCILRTGRLGEVSMTTDDVAKSLESGKKAINFLSIERFLLVCLLCQVTVRRPAP